MWKSPNGYGQLLLHLSPFRNYLLRLLHAAPSATFSAALSSGSPSSARTSLAWCPAGLSQSLSADMPSATNIAPLTCSFLGRDTWRCPGPPPRKSSCFVHKQELSLIPSAVARRRPGRSSTSSPAALPWACTTWTMYASCVPCMV
jgi:hypothetical protein